VRRGALPSELRRTRNSAETTEQLLLDAAKRVFAQKGYIRATVQDIIEATGLSRGTFYLHFRSTDDIFVRTITKVVDEFIASSRVRSGDTLRQRVYDSNLRYFEIFGANRGILRAFFEASYVDPEIGRIWAEMRSASAPWLGTARAATAKNVSATTPAPETTPLSEVRRTSFSSKL